jgi:hypothetical protein
MGTKERYLAVRGRDYYDYDYHRRAQDGDTEGG